LTISREDVVRVADLAHLELSPGEIDTYRSQLDEILRYIDKLNQLDLTNVEPMAQGISRAPVGEDGARESHPELRDDVAQRCAVADAVLAQATDAAKPFFRVPKVIDR
jgi:aspartyl-tRNA(Asn)/glutamyl-tRNA(Gln) amidotransferase subunit C